MPDLTVIDENEAYRFRIEVRDILDVLTDPATVTLAIEKSDGTALSGSPFSFPATITKEAVGIYAKDVIPSDPGVWTATWNTTGTPTVQETEQIYVRAAPSSLPGETIDPRALCSLEDVRTYLGIKVGDRDEDGTLIRLINAASDAIYDQTGREFRPIGTQPETRMIEVLRPAGFARNEVEIGDVAEITAVSLGGTALAAPPDGYVELPRVRNGFGPITALRIYGTGVAGGSEIEITGTFGFPRVPEDVRQAAIVTACEWHSRDVQKFSATFRLDTGAVELPDDFPRQVWKTIGRWRKESVYGAATVL